MIAPRFEGATTVAISTHKLGNNLKAAMAITMGLLVGCAAEDNESQPTAVSSVTAPVVQTQSVVLQDGTQARTGVQTPFCERPNSDPDGDGWGWENQRTCRSIDDGAGSMTTQSGKLPVGIVYYLWHCTTKRISNRYVELGLPSGEEFNITRVLNGQQPAWGTTGSFHWWDRPDEGYYCLGNQPDVIVRHLEMLRDAGVDFLVLDITNHPNIESFNARDVILKSLHPLLEAASTVPGAPRIVPWMPFAADSQQSVDEKNRICNANSAGDACARLANPQSMYQYVTDLLQNEYSELTYQYKGKPLVLDAANDKKFPRSTTEVIGDQLESAWTVRRMWGLRNNNDEWQFLTTCSNPVEFHKSNGWASEGCNQPVNANEQISVAAAYQYTHISEPFTPVGQSGTVFTGGMPKFQGRTLAQQFRVAFEHRDAEPMVILTGWNEWIAQRFDRDGRVVFVDAYDHTLNRDIEPGGVSGDLYYHLMKDLVTQYKNDKPFAFEDYFLTKTSIFDAEFYWTNHADLQQAFDSGDQLGLHQHWLTTGIYEGRQPSALFNADYYRNRYPGLAAAGLTTPEGLLQHFIDSGFIEGRQGSEVFHAPTYVQRYPNVAAMFGQNGYYKASKYYLEVGQHAPNMHSARP